MGTVLRGITSYVQQRVEGWRTGSRGSQAFLLLVFVALVGAAAGIGELAQVVHATTLVTNALMSAFAPLETRKAILAEQVRPWFERRVTVSD